MPSVIFVCLGNICRSPAAEGILRNLAAKDPQYKNLLIKSCGLGSWHVGQAPDARMQEAIKKRGINLTSRAQQFQQDFFDRFDYILVSDHEVLNVLQKYAVKSHHKEKLNLITAFSPNYQGQEVPDPYYGGDAGFELVLDMLEDSCEGLLQHIKQTNINP